MATLQRPQFYEGQILGASDLATLMEYGRAQDARDRRLLHLWGIADGLELTIDSGEITIGTGMAIDSSGAQIIVTEAATITASDLPDQPSASSGSNETYFPIFLSALQESSASSGSFGRCSTNGLSSRIDESFTISVGRAAEATDWDDQEAPAIDEGPDDSAASARYVLLGFAVWDAQNQELSDAVTENSDGITPRYVGVRGDAVESISGSIALRTQPAGESGALMFVLDKDDADRELSFGADNGSGAINDPVFRVDSKGNITAKGDLVVAGALQGKLSTGTALVQSGVATDGAVIPLPTGVDQEQVDSGSVALHIIVTPRVDLSSIPTGLPVASVIATVQECSVDGDHRVRCTLRWVDVANIGGGVTDRPGVCDYLIVAAVPSS